MPFIEAPTTFYLGRRYDPNDRKMTSDIVYYDARDLVTHAIVVGMTGSGKTGLCIDILEEAILDNIPAIIIDPKGDITNLLLTFPDFKPEDFKPWVNLDDARRAGLDMDSYAADQAARWQDGLANWGIVPDRLRWLKGIAQYSIYTPGSDSGLPISILASLAAPKEGWIGNEESLREKINGIVTALLALIGLNVEPVKDKEHVLVANIFEYNWSQGISLTLEDIITQVQKPPFTKLGVLPIDDYMSEKARFKLAMALNNIVAAPSFQSWINGEPLDIQKLMYQPNGRARVSIFYIAHLNEAERQFIITLILENMLGWMRMQSGTTSLRSILYIDEMFGYFPPYPKNPPTKDPLLRLLKQARAFGLGLVLATQNPGDLDYKGLSNAGTWFIGRLTSDNDRQRVMSGLESLASAQQNLNLADVNRLIADIEPRVFLMNNVHDTGGPVMVHSRWAMSYLRGPLTRQQVTQLMANQKQELMARLGAARPAVSGFTQAMPAAPASMPGMGGGNLPPLPPEMGYGAQAAPPMPPMPPGMTNAMPPVPPGSTLQMTQPMSNPGWTQSMPPQSTQATTLRNLNAPPGFSATQPALPAATTQYFIPATVSAQQAIDGYIQQTRIMAMGMPSALLAYRPVLLAQAQVRYQDKKAQMFTAQPYAYLVPDVQKAGIVAWEQALATPVDPRRLSGVPLAAAIYADMPPGLTDSKRMTALQKELVDMLYTVAKIEVPFNPTLGIYGAPGADPSNYWAQVQQLAHENRDKEIDALAAKYEKLMDSVEDKLRRNERNLSAERKELADLKREEFFTKGEALLSLFKGRTTYTLSRTSRATRFRRQSQEQMTDLEREIADLEEELQKIQDRAQGEINAINDKWAKVAAEAVPYVITPFKKDIQVELFGIGWVPYYYVELNGQPLLLPGYY
ncbi:MAG TPA: DUF87 domain-containing protein [Aggregatilineales bacterium]|nr:DUF87 domain-containing protein [Aggregatilineales bacterium]